MSGPGGEHNGQVEVARAPGGGHTRLIALTIAALLIGVVYVGLSGRPPNPGPPSPVGSVPATTLPSATAGGGPVYVGASSHPQTPAPPSPSASVPATALPSAPGGRPALALYVPAGSSSHQPGDYGIVVNWDEGGAVASATATLDEGAPGVLSATYGVTIPSRPTRATIKLFEFGSESPTDDQVIGGWAINVSPDEPALLLNFTTAPAIDAIGLPNLFRAGYRIQATLGGGPASLSVTVTAGLVGVLHPGEFYEIRTAANGVRLIETMHQLEPGHLRASEPWAPDSARQARFRVGVISSAGAQLSDLEVIGSWSVRIRRASRVPSSGVTLLDARVARLHDVEIVGVVGYHVTLTETVDQGGVRLTFDVYPKTAS